ncbi:MAG: hypothetical protein AB7I48_19750, partial [Planctomycetaceae bacterium]
MPNSILRRPLRAALAVGVCLCGATAAFAAIHREHAVIDLPGVDHHGNLDLGHLSPGGFKITINTRTKRVIAVGHGTVRKLSGRRQVDRNQATMNAGLVDYPEGQLKRDLFVV